MKKSILDLEDVQVLKKNELKTINGAWQLCCKSPYNGYPGCDCPHY